MTIGHGTHDGPGRQDETQVEEHGNSQGGKTQRARGEQVAKRMKRAHEGHDRLGKRGINMIEGGT